MIDTFAISKTLIRAPDKSFLLDQGWRQCFYDADGNCTKYTSNRKSELKPRLSLTKRFDNKWSLRAEVSLGSWLYPSNLHLVNEAELKHGLDVLSVYVEEKSGVAFEAHTERVTRVDFTRDFKIADTSVIQIIERFSKMTLAKYNRQPINETSVYFRNAGKEKTKEYKIYCKHTELLKKTKNASEQEKAKGVLRFEIAFWNDAVNRLAASLKLPNHRANHILTKETSERIIQKEMNLLLFETILTSDVSDILRLFEHCNHKTACELVAFLALRKKFGGNLAELPNVNLSKRTCQRRWKKCRELGVLSLE